MASGNPANSEAAESSALGLKFALQFLAAAALCGGLLARWPQCLGDLARDITVANAKALGGFIGLTMAASGDILSVNGFSMKVILECTALHYVIILAIAIMLYTRHSIRYRLIGVVLATLLILAINALRLVLTGLAGSVSAAAFHFVHEYLWVALFALLVFGIWKVWADGRLEVGRAAARQAGLVALSTGTVFLLLFAFKDAHCRMLAALATPMFKLLMADPLATVAWRGQLEFCQGGVTARTGTFFEIANVAVYLGLVLPKLRTGRRMLSAALIGLVLLTVMCAEFIAFLGMHCIRHAERASFYQSTGVGVLLALPMAMYWIVVKLGEKELKQTREVDISCP